MIRRAFQRQGSGTLKIKTWVNAPGTDKPRVVD